MATLVIKSESYSSFDFDPNAAVVAPYGLSITPSNNYSGAAGGGNLFVPWANIKMIWYQTGETQIEMSGDIWRTLFDLQKEVIELKAKHG